MKNDSQSNSSRRIRIVERTAATALLLVLASLAWIIAAARWPEWLRLVSLEFEVLVVLALLIAALALVSVVALRHTRPGDH